MTRSDILCENIFQTLSLPNGKSKGAGNLREGSPPPTCPVSHVTFHVSRLPRPTPWLKLSLLTTAGGGTAEYDTGPIGTSHSYTLQRYCQPANCSQERVKKIYLNFSKIIILSLIYEVLAISMNRTLVNDGCSISHSNYSDLSLDTHGFIPIRQSCQFNRVDVTKYIDIGTYVIL